MTLKPLPQAALTVSRITQMAHELLLEADALETTYKVYQPTRHVEFEFTKKLRDQRKAAKK